MPQTLPLGSTSSTARDNGLLGEKKKGNDAFGSLWSIASSKDGRSGQSSVKKDASISTLVKENASQGIWGQSSTNNNAQSQQSKNVVGDVDLLG